MVACLRWDGDGVLLAWCGSTPVALIEVQVCGSGGALIGYHSGSVEVKVDAFSGRVVFDAVLLDLLHNLRIS